MKYNIGEEVQFSVGTEIYEGIIYTVYPPSVLEDNVHYDIVVSDSDGNRSLYEYIDESVVN